MIASKEQLQSAISENEHLVIIWCENTQKYKNFIAYFGKAISDQNVSPKILFGKLSISHHSNETIELITHKISRITEPLEEVYEEYNCHT
jgi:hypothetical protein